MNSPHIDRLAALPSLSKIPRHELQWLIDHGVHEFLDVGLLGPKGFRTNFFWIILSGRIVIIVDRGTGPKMVTEWTSGQVIGLLPYSRMVTSPGDTYVEEQAEALKIDEKTFPQMIKECPSFTAFTVHSMLDRVRVFNTSDLQDEKMVSLGRLASGLAHELNNPASVTVRDAKMLKSSLDDLNSCWRMISKMSLSDPQYESIDNLRSLCQRKFGKKALSSIEKADRQDELAGWLAKNNLDNHLATALADTNMVLSDLENLAEVIPGEALNVVLRWIIASCSVHTLTTDMENSARKIYDLVDTVKKFTFMDSMAEGEFQDVESGLRDTIRMLKVKIESRGAIIKLDVEEKIPHVFANGSELNQVWLNLIDNALDAVPDKGKINITARYELNRVVVCITDNGAGIDKDILDKIFDPFFTTKPPGQGTGLGLDLTRRLLRRYKGDITVRSRPGCTEFRVSLIAGTAQPPKKENKGVK